MYIFTALKKKTGGDIFVITVKKFHVRTKPNSVQVSQGVKTSYTGAGRKKIRF